MAVRRLTLRELSSRRMLEASDIRAALERTIRTRWGVDAPLFVRGLRKGVLRIETSSTVWRAEVLSQEDDLREAIQKSLPTLPPVERLSVVLR